MDIKDIFNPNSYTKKVMPICEQICAAFDGEIDLVSDDIQECRKKHDLTSREFTNSLSVAQLELYEKYYDGQVEEYTIATREHFNRGLYLGARLMLELLGTQQNNTN